MISSPQNPKIQWVRKLQTQSRVRLRDQAFVIEGVRLVEEALHSDWQTQLVLFSNNLDQRGKEILEEFIRTGTPTEEVTPQVMVSMSDTPTPQGILAIVNQKEVKSIDNAGFIFIPDAIRDPGNLGTMLRTAFAAGCDAIFVPKGSVDVFSPKVVRSAMGAHFHLPILPLTWQEIMERVRRLDLHVFLADANSGVNYLQASYRQPLALIIGGEAEGAGVEAQEIAHERLFIPMPGKAESLNAAVAAGILLFNIAHHRTSSS